MTLSEFLEPIFKLSNYDHILELAAHGDKIIMRTAFAIYVIEDNPHTQFSVKKITEV